MEERINTKELLYKCEQWSKEDTARHSAIVVLRDEENDNIHYCGTPKDMAKLIYAFMELDEDMAIGVFRGATLFAYKNFEGKAIHEANVIAKTIAEVRRGMTETTNNNE